MKNSNKHLEKRQMITNLKESLSHLQERYEHIKLRIKSIEKKIVNLESDSKGEPTEPFDMKFED